MPHRIADDQVRHCGVTSPLSAMRSQGLPFEPLQAQERQDEGCEIVGQFQQIEDDGEHGFTSSPQWRRDESGTMRPAAINVLKAKAFRRQWSVEQARWTRIDSCALAMVSGAAGVAWSAMSSSSRTLLSMSDLG